MSSKETDGNKTADGESTGFQTAKERREDAGDYIPRDIDVHDVSGTRLTSTVLEVPDYDGSTRRIFLTDQEAEQLLDQLTEQVDGVSL